MMRLDRAERLGLAYEEYTLEVLERGRHLGEQDARRVAEIKAVRRRSPYRTANDRCKFRIDFPASRLLLSAPMKQNLILVVGRRVGKAV